MAWREHGFAAAPKALEVGDGELDEVAVRSEQATARIAEAAEREAALRSLAEELLDRYRGMPAPGEQD